MTTEVTMPQLGSATTAGVVVSWEKQIGDTVEVGEPLVEVKTKKFTTRIDSEVSGTVVAIMAKVGATVAVDGLLCVIGTADENTDQLDDHNDVPPAAENSALDTKQSSKPAGGINISPLARRIATEKNFDYANIIGSGPRGRITSHDIMTAIEQQEADKASELAAEEKARTEKIAAAETASKEATAAEAIAAAEAAAVPFTPPHDIEFIDDEDDIFFEEDDQSEDDAPVEQKVSPRSFDESDADDGHKTDDQAPIEDNFNQYPFSDAWHDNDADEHTATANTHVKDQAESNGDNIYHDVAPVFDAEPILIDDNNDHRDTAHKTDADDFSTSDFITDAEVETLGDIHEHSPLPIARRIMTDDITAPTGAIPAYNQTVKVDVTALLHFRNTINGRTGNGRAGNGQQRCRISINDLVLKAVARALTHHPDMLVSLKGQDIIRHENIHIAMAVALDEGMIMPVIHNADRLGLDELSQVTKDLVARAHDGMLSHDMCKGSTFSISNLGMFGIESFVPAINPPNAAVLGICSIEDELALEDDQPVMRKVMRLSMSYDRRLMDGAMAARFQHAVKMLLENPLDIVL